MDIERLNELKARIDSLRAELNPLLKEYHELAKQVKTEHYKTLPLIPHVGYYFHGKNADLYLYFSYAKDENGNHNFYRKPLYNANGNLIGQPVPKKHILSQIEKLQKMGYVEIE